MQWLWGVLWQNNWLLWHFNSFLVNYLVQGHSLRPYQRPRNNTSGDRDSVNNTRKISKSLESATPFKEKVYHRPLFFFLTFLLYQNIHIGTETNYLRTNHSKPAGCIPLSWLKGQLWKRWLKLPLEQISRLLSDGLDEALGKCLSGQRCWTPTAGG